MFQQPAQTLLKPRPYQSAALDALHLFWAAGGKSGLIVLPTAAGKSLVLAMLCRELIEKYDVRIAILSHVKELLEQDQDELRRWWSDADIGVISAGLGRRETGHAISIAGIQTVYRDPALLGAIDIALIDEAHLVGRRAESMYGTVIAALRKQTADMPLVGLTATAYRMDSGRLDEGNDSLFEAVVYEAKIGNLIGEGWLSPLVSYGGAAKIDTSRVGIRSGEYILAQLELAAMDGYIVERAVVELVRRAAGRKSWLVFGVGVKHVRAITHHLQARGIAAASVYGAMSMDERRKAIEAFRRGALQALVSCNVLSVGFNVPQVDLIALMRPTRSAGLYVQQVGRGFRLAPGKKDTIVLDFSGNVRRFGPVDDPLIAKGSGKAGKHGREPVSAKECPDCQAFVRLDASECPVCGHEFRKMREPKHATRPDDAPILSSQIPAVQDVAVNGWRFSPHNKPDRPRSLRVDYWCGILQHSQWLCFEHGGYPAHKAGHWWGRNGGRRPVPATVEEALARARELAMPETIRVRPDGTFWEVLS